jgi:hypothetical protein
MGIKEKSPKRVAVAAGAFIVAGSTDARRRLSDGQPLGHKRGSMAGRAANRRAALYRHRARDLVQRAKDIRGECDRRHMLELAATYERTADNLAPAPAPSEPATVFTRREILRR